MGVEGGGAVRADDAEVLQPVVVAPAVDVIEDETHRVTAPELSLAAQLAPARFQAVRPEALLERAARVRRPGDEDLLERPSSRSRYLGAPGIRVEMIRRD
jgi:hypothetical protein